MKELYIKIVSPEKILFEGNAQFIKLPGIEGQFSILSEHAPLISALGKGQVVYEIKKDEPKSIEISSGFVEVNKNTVTVCIE